MASIDCKFISETLGTAASMRVLLPEPKLNEPARAPHPVLFLLHGLGDDETAWTRFSSLERYVTDLNLAVVMPNVHRSYYSNMKSGYRYWDFVSQEVLHKARALFPISNEREHTFAAGLSMGGYGALKLGFSKPDTFAAVASMSAPCELVGLQKRPADLALIFGDFAGIREVGGDLSELARRVAAARGPKPKIFQSCGLEDMAMLNENRRFRDFVAPLGFDYLYEEGPGKHDWPYWDAAIQRVLRWLPL